MRLIVRFATVSVTAFCTAVLIPGLAQANDDGSTTQVVYAEATAQRTTVERSTVAVVVSRGSTLNAHNEAAAYSHDCTGCRAIAVSFQAVLVPTTTTTATPENYAVALNQNCTGCTSFAFADQFIVNTNGVTRLSHWAEARIEKIQSQVDQVTESGAAPADMDAKLQALQQQFHDAVLAGLSRHSDEDDHSDEQHSQS
jgi:hypothetical protein